MMTAPADVRQVKCAMCGRHLGRLVGLFAEYAPCQCGYRTTVEAVGRRARQEIETPGTGRIEVK